MVSMQETSSTEIAGLKKTLETFSEHHKGTKEREYKRAVKDLKAQQRAAVEDRDTEKYDTIQKDIEDLEKPVEEPVNPEDSPDWAAWHQKNPWFETSTGTDGADIEMTMYAEQVGQYLQTKGKYRTDMDYFNAITGEVKKKFPGKFENTNRDRQASVGTSESTQTQTQTKNKKTYDNLPKNAKAACDRMCNEKINGKALMTKEQYLSEYEWE